MEYRYTELKKTAISGDQTALRLLGKWFENYGTAAWNGEYYDAEELRLFPIYKEEEDDIKIIGYDFR